VKTGGAMWLRLKRGRGRRGAGQKSQKPLMGPESEGAKRHDENRPELVGTAFLEKKNARKKHKKGGRVGKTDETHKNPCPRGIKKH